MYNLDLQRMKLPDMLSLNNDPRWCACASSGPALTLLCLKHRHLRHAAFVHITARRAAAIQLARRLGIRWQLPPASSLELSSVNKQHIFSVWRTASCGYDSRSMAYAVDEQVESDDFGRRVARRRLRVFSALECSAVDGQRQNGDI